MNKNQAKEQMKRASEMMWELRAIFYDLADFLEQKGSKLPKTKENRLEATEMRQNSISKDKGGKEK